MLDPDVLSAVPPEREVSIEREIFPTLVGHGLYGFAQDCRWIDIGTPASFLEANLEAAGESGVVDPAAVIGAGAEVIGSVVGPRAEMGAGARVVRSVVLADGRVPSGEIVENAVVNHQGVVW